MNNTLSEATLEEALVQIRAACLEQDQVIVAKPTKLLVYPPLLRTAKLILQPWRKTRRGYYFKRRGKK